MAGVTRSGEGTNCGKLGRVVGLARTQQQRFGLGLGFTDKIHVDQRGQHPHRLAGGDSDGQPFALGAGGVLLKGSGPFGLGVEGVECDRAPWPLSLACSGPNRRRCRSPQDELIA